jgi:ribonuclease Z
MHGKHIVAAISFALATIVGATVAKAADEDLRVTLLGTGTPGPRPDRFGPSELVQAGDQTLLIDAGRGATIRLTQLRISLSKLDAVLLTHYHSDHTEGFPDIWLTGWLPPAFGQRKSPMHVIGPTGAKALIAGLQQAYAADLEIREADEKLPPQGVEIEVQEFAEDGVVYDKDGLRVTAFQVDHGAAVKPAYGYRFDYNGHSAVISGDTRLNENVIEHATGVDLLIHEVAAAKPELLKIPAFQRIMAHHTSARETGEVFSRAHPKLAAYTHIVRLGTKTVAEPSLADIVAEARQTYQGPLVVGEDLMVFDIGAGGGVAVYRAGS